MVCRDPSSLLQHIHQYSYAKVCFNETCVGLENIFGEIVSTIYSVPNTCNKFCTPTNFPCYLEKSNENPFLSYRGAYLQFPHKVIVRMLQLYRLVKTEICVKIIIKFVTMMARELSTRNVQKKVQIWHLLSSFYHFINLLHILRYLISVIGVFISGENE